MDIIQIILVIGAVIAGLIILWAIIASVLAVAAKKQFDKTTKKQDAEYDAFRKRHGLR
ncbi:hypothetical protein [Glutamicibacter ardleyensis]|uniref:hypothetical protein n=1 Tax=Glutamicibacter ardleyensis TaxID=225894 RepID=UPI003FD0847A